MDKKQTKQLVKYVEDNVTTILNIRNRILDAHPVQLRNIYISDAVIRSNEKGEIHPSKVYFDTENFVFGMRIVLDYRVPFGQFFLTEDPLEGFRSKE